MFDCYRQGVGSAMISEIERIAKEAGAAGIAFEMQRKAYWARDFYLKNGYEILDWEALGKSPFKGTLPHPPVEATYVFGKVIE